MLSNAVASSVSVLLNPRHGCVCQFSRWSCCALCCYSTESVGKQNPLLLVILKKSSFCEMNRQPSKVFIWCTLFSVSPRPHNVSIPQGLYLGSHLKTANSIFHLLCLPWMFVCLFCLLVRYVYVSNAYERRLFSCLGSVTSHPSLGLKKHAHTLCVAGPNNCRSDTWAAKRKAENARKWVSFVA